MVHEPKDPRSSSTPPRNIRRPRSISAPQVQPTSNHNVIPPEDPNAALLAHFATAALTSQALSYPSSYGTMVPQGDYSLLNPFMFHHLPFNQPGGTVNTQLPPFSALDSSWSQFPPLHQASQPSGFKTVSANTEMTPHVYGLHSPSTVIANASGNDASTHMYGTGSVPNATASSPASAGASDQEQETSSIAEDKRRRNTAASARFRIKKKQKTVNLERSVSDLTGRAEDLEREVVELRRENGWLKEIIMLKGSRIAGINLASHIIAENQRVAESLPGPSQNVGARRQAADVVSEDSSSEEEPTGDAKSEAAKKRERRKEKSRKK